MIESEIQLGNKKEKHSTMDVHQEKLIPRIECKQ